MCVSTSLAERHHQVGKLVGHDDDIRHVRGNLAALLLVLRTDPLHQFLLAQLVVAAEVPHSRSGKQMVALFHFFHGPAENRLGLLHVGDHGMHEVRQALVLAELDHLGIDHQHADLVGPAGHDHRRDDRVQADAFARARAAGDQEVRQRRQIDRHRIARHVLAEVDRDAHFLDLAVGLFDDLAEADDLPRGVGNFDADGILARDRRDDPHARHPQGDRQVVGETGDLAQPQAGLELDFELGDHRPGLDLDHADVEAELPEGLFQDFGLAADLVLLLVEVERLAGQEEFDTGQFVIGRVLLRLVELQFFVLLGRLRLADPQERSEAAAGRFSGRRFRLGSRRGG